MARKNSYGGSDYHRLVVDGDGAMKYQGKDLTAAYIRTPHGERPDVRDSRRMMSAAGHDPSWGSNHRIEPLNTRRAEKEGVMEIIKSRSLSQGIDY